MLDIAYPLAGFYSLATPGQWVVIYSVIVLFFAFIGAVNLSADGGGFWVGVVAGALVGIGIIVAWTVLLAIGSIGFFLWNL